MKNIVTAPMKKKLQSKRQIFQRYTHIKVVANELQAINKNQKYNIININCMESVISSIADLFHENVLLCENVYINIEKNLY